MWTVGHLHLIIIQYNDLLHHLLLVRLTCKLCTKCQVKFVSHKACSPVSRLCQLTRTLTWKATSIRWQTASLISHPLHLPPAHFPFYFGFLLGNLQSSLMFLPHSSHLPLFSCKILGRASGRLDGGSSSLYGPRRRPEGKKLLSSVVPRNHVE